MTTRGPWRLARRLAEPTAAAGAAFVLGAILTWLSGLWLTQNNRQVAASHFSAVARRTSEQIRERLKIYEYGLRGSRGAVLSAGYEQFDRRSFHQYAESRDVDREFPGARGMGVVRRLAAADETAFVIAARADGKPDFAIQKLEPHTGDRYVIQYIEPAQRNLQAIGLDIASETNRRTAAEVSMRTGAATLTAPLMLLQAPSQPQRSFLLLLPIYRPEWPLTTAEERADATVGWAFAPLVMDEVLADFGFGDDFSLALRDAKTSDTDPFFATASAARAAAANLSERIAIPIYGRTWQAELRATPGFVAELNLLDPRELVALGLGIAALFAVLVYIRAQSSQRQAQVQEQQARLAAIVATSNDAIIGETLDGIITDWNHGAELLFGYGAESALGRPAASLLLSADRAAEDAEIRKTMARGMSLAPFDTTRLHANGSVLDVSVTASPIAGPAGTFIGFSKTIRDISDAKRAERSVKELNANLEQQVVERTALLEAARHNLQAILDAVPFAVAYVDPSMTIRFANAACRDWFGRSAAELIGVHTRELLGDRFEVSRPYLEAALRGEPQTFEAPMPLPGREGQRHTVRQYLPDVTGGQVQGFYVVAYDITDQVAAKLRLAAALRDNEALLAELQRTNDRIAMTTDRAGIGIWEVDMIGGTSTWDDGMYRLWGRSASDGEPPLALWANNLHPDDRARAERELGDALAGVRDFDTEFRIIRPNGEVTYLKATGRVVRDAAGQAVRMTGVNFDITERKRAELELLETSSLLRTVLESASEVSIIAADPNLQIKVFNGGAELMLGYTSDEIVNRTTPVLFHDLDEVRARAEELTRLAGQPVEGGAAFIHPLALRQPHEWTYVRKDRSRLTVSLIVTAMLGADGELFGYVGVAHDVTRQKQYEASLRDAIHRAEQANQAKSQFLANMSHEIRTPLNAVIGLSYLLGQTALDSDQGALLSKIRLAGKSLLTLVNDTLDLSKIEAGELTIEHARFDLRSVIDDVREVMSVQAEAKHITHDVDIPEDLASTFEGDATRVSQILTNLVSNAIKFTEHGSVRLSVRQQLTSATHATLRFEVQDTGIGIAPEAQLRLFVPFAQADSSTTRRFGGTGLGLSIVKRLAELMGGQVGLSSVAGTGSTFWVSLRLGIASTQGPALAKFLEPARGRCALLGVRVLVVDDSDINREVAERILELEGAMVSCASNGQEAVERLQVRPNAFDVVLMDVQMPILDGYAAARRIRGELGLTTVPIIALTADARSSERLRSQSVGMVDFVSKPFEAHVLVQTILRHLEPEARRASLSQTATMTSSAPAGVWPEIEGIDAGDSRTRLGGDRELFKTLLFHLVREFEDLATLRDGSAALGLVALTARAHKLRGSAGQLGAREMYALAGKIEDTCRSGAPRGLAPLLTRLSALLQRLRLSAELNLGSLELAHESVPSSEQDFDPMRVEELVGLLREQNLSVLDHFTKVSAQLRSQLGQVAFETMKDHVENLRFHDALEIVEHNQSGHASLTA